MLGFGRNARRRAGTHHVDHDDRDLAGGGKPQCFHHQRQARTGGRGQGRRSAVGRADDHVDGGQFVLGLKQHSAYFGQIGCEPFEDFRRRRDRIGGGKAHAAADRSEPGRLVAGYEPPLGAAYRLRPRQPQAEIEAGGGGHARLQSGAARLDCGRAFVGQPLLDHRHDNVLREPEQAGGNAERDHVRAPVGNGFRHFLDRDLDHACTAAADRGRQVAAARVADHQAMRRRLDFGAETMGVEPIDTDEEIEMFRRAFDRAARQTQQGRGFPAADLRTYGPRQQSVPSRRACRFKEEIAGGQRTGAAAAKNCDGNAVCLRHAGVSG